MKFKVEKNYIKPPVKAIIDRAEEFIPYGYYCNEPNEYGQIECPFLQWRKMTPSRLEKFKKTFTNTRTGETKVYYDIPWGNVHLQYCSYLKKYLDIQDCIKDCRIKDYWPDEPTEDEVAKNCFVVSVDELSEEETKELLEKIKTEIEKNPRYRDIQVIYNNPGPIENSIYVNEKLNEDEINEINKVISQIKIKEKYNLLATKYANKKEED